MPAPIARGSLSAVHGVAAPVAAPSAPVATSAQAVPSFRRGPQDAAATEAPVAPVRAARANKYPGNCTGCGKRVEAGEGVAKNVAGRWTVEHVGGACPMLSAEEASGKIQSATGQVFDGPLLPGIYTMTDRNEQHRTYRVRVQRTDATFAPGETIIEFLSGPDNSSDYTPFGFIKPGALVVWKKFRDGGHDYTIGGARALIADPSRAQVARTCIRCQRLLTTPESIARGMGPECAEKGW